MTDSSEKIRALALDQCTEMAQTVTAMESASFLVATIHGSDSVPPEMADSLASAFGKMCSIGWIIFCQIKAMERDSLTEDG